ncbi:hypothetical protein GCM10011289_19650 [Paludibacterium paludis]|uniref:Multidrug resistance protein NorM n=1 Tax=Paludibacterium paludis TaxID=1225769 RepID=A0A918P365_9NEIS|nr:hypothetical protein GCM10011289_19650 [Paludibacterium paludis]
MNHPAILRQALTISASRLISLSMASTDLMVLGRMAWRDASDFALASQWAQVFVVLAVTLNVGVVLVYRAGRVVDSRLAGRIAAYALAVGGALCLASLALPSMAGFSSSARAIYLVLAAGLVPMTLHIACCHLLEAEGFAPLVLCATAALACLNGVLDVVFVACDAVPSGIAVALSTTVVRVAGMVLGCALVASRLGIRCKPDWSADTSKALFGYGRSEAATGLAFTGGLALLCTALAAQSGQASFARFGIALNFMNTVSILFTGFSLSLTQYFAKRMPPWQDRVAGVLALSLVYIVAWIAVLLPSCGLVARWYLGRADGALAGLFAAGLVVVMLDGMAQILIGLLRLAGQVAVPPMFRLSMVVFGIPLSLLGFDGENFGWVMAGLAFGNAVATCLAFSALYVTCRRTGADEQGQ